MGYTTGSGRYANTVELNLMSGTSTASANGTAVELGDRGTARLTLAVTAGSGTTPTLDITIETSADGTTWRTAGTFTQATGVTSERKSFSGIDKFIRARSTIAGTTPSFTFSIIGDAC